jgi:hypothetical protein
MVIGTSCIILCTVRMVTVVEEAPAGQFFLKRNEIKRQPYYGGGGLADFSLASRAPKAHDGPRNKQQTNIKHVLLCIRNQLITNILNQCY